MCAELEIRRCLSHLFHDTLSKWEKISVFVFVAKFLRSHRGITLPFFFFPEVE